MRGIVVVRCLLLAWLLIVGTSAAAQAPEDGAEEAAVAQPAAVLLEEVEQLRSQYREFAAQRDELEGEERAIAELQMRKRLLEFFRKMAKLIAEVTSLDEAQADAVALRKRTRALVAELDERIEPFLDAIQEDLSKLRTARREAPEAEFKDFDARIRGLEQILDETFRFFLNHVEHLEGLGLPADSARKRLTANLLEHAEGLAGRLELTSQRVRAAQKESKASAGNAALETAVRVAVDRRDTVAASLRMTCDVMDAVGLPTAGHRQLLIQATGEITTDVLNVEVARGLLEQAREALARWTKRNTPILISRLGVFVTIMLLFWVLGAAARRAVARLLRNSEQSVSELARQILVGTAARIVIGIGFFVALSQLGVNVTALLTGLGIAGFIVGFALQDTLGNFASGAMILMYRPYDVGDVIEAGGVSGKVDSMNLVSTTILTFDNQTLIVPNSRIWGDVIRNMTSQKIRRVDLSFGLAHDTDLERAEELFASVLRDHAHVLEEPAPAIKVHELSDSAIEFIVRPWVRTEHYWETYWGLNREIKLRLDHEGIQLGVPRRDVRVRTASRDD